MADGEISLRDALQNIESGNITERKKGLADLKHILRYNSSNTRAQTIPDKDYIQIFRTLFQAALDGRSTLAKTKTSTTRVTAENRLTEISSALRICVEAGVSTIRLRTAKALRDHVFDTIYLSAGGFCEPLALDYVKCLRTLFSFQPHVEQMVTEWDEIVTFCLDCLKSVEAEIVDESGNLENGLTPSATNGSSYRSSSRSMIRESASSQDSRSNVKKVADEIVGCLSRLTAAPNMPLKKQAKDILWALIKHLRASTVATPSNLDAFTAINNVLSWTRTENTELTQDVTSHLVRLIRQLWQAKSHTTPHMLTSLLLLQPYIARAMRRQPAIVLGTDLAGLAQYIQSEYGRDHSSTKQLNLDEIRLEINNKQQSVYGKVATLLFTLKPIGARAESNWLLVNVLAGINKSLIMSGQECSRAVEVERDDDDGIDLNPRSKKRRRQQDPFTSLIDTVTSGPSPTRICALQVLAFLAQEMKMSSSQLTRTLEALSVSCGDEHGGIASWSFLALASCACQAAATDVSSASHWSSAWQVASRSLSNAPSCRAASYALYIIMRLRLIPQSSVTELIQLATNALDLSGPALLSDAVSLLLREVLKASHQLNPGGYARTAESIIGWLSHNFTPSRIQEKDKGYAAASSAYESTDVSLLVADCVGQDMHSLPTVGLLTWEGPGRAWLMCRGQEEMINYLLLRPADDQVTTSTLEDAAAPSLNSSASAQISCETQLLAHLVGETTRTNEAWGSLLKERARPGLDTWSMLCKGYCAINCISSCMSFKDARRHQHLREQNTILLNALCDYTTSPSCEDAKMDILLATLSQTLPGLNCRHVEIEHRPTKCETAVCTSISAAIAHRQNRTQIYDDMDAMDAFGDFDSQDSGRGRVAGFDNEPSNDLDAAFSQSTLRSSLTLYARVVVTLSAQGNGSGAATEQSAGHKIVDYLCDQSEAFILSSRDTIAALPRLGIMLSSQDIEKLLTFFIETKGAFINSYTSANSEVVLGTILDVLCSQITAWTDQSNTSLYNLGLDMYDWWTERLSQGFLSANVQERLATLFLEICRVNPDYTPDTGSSAASPMRNILQLLEQGGIPLMFHLSKRLSEVFGIFVLAEHKSIFDDIVEQLPGDTQWLEGMAMRLLIFSNLGSAWQSLLRYCVYYIFEAAGRVSESLKHATHCIRQLATSLPLKSPRKLFSCFAPQLLHTYIDTKQPLTRLPFAAFQYMSLTDLLKANEAEVCAQLVTRSCKEGLDTMSKHLKLMPGDLVRQSFAKCMAYTLGRDIALNDGKADMEHTLRNLVNGKEEAKALVNERWPTIVGYLYLSLRLDDPEDNWLTADSGLAGPAQSLSEMKRYSYSRRKLPDCQQPSFPSRKTFYAIDRLNRRLNQENSPWRPSSFILVARMLLDSIDESLGSLHACLMIRRLRVLICMAGEVAYQGFALEMLLHSIRPFVSDAECADDALGILQYLFHHGREQLSENREFLRGTIILLVLQVQKHCKAKRERSTQESQHTATVQRMGDFQKWLVEYLGTTLGDAAVSCDIALREALLRLQLPGNARHNTPESSFLLFLLDQWRPESPVCSRADATEAFGLFSESFDAPPPVSDDCLGDDGLAISFSQPLWDVVRSASLSETFIAWAAQVLGRAYSASGVRPQKLTKTGVFERQTIRDAVEGGNILAESQATLAKRTVELLFSRSRTEASLAEHCLRRLWEMQGADAEEAFAFEQMLPDTICDVARETTFSYQPALVTQQPAAVIDLESLRQRLRLFQSSSTEEWTTSMAVGLCGWASDVPRVASLSPLLQHVDGLASELLPSIIHVLLTREMDYISGPSLRAELSTAFTECLSQADTAFQSKQCVILELLLYLRSQQYPDEDTILDRHRWLEVDYVLAAEAGARCGMPVSALLFAESVSSPVPAVRGSGKRASTRASFPQMSQEQASPELLFSIFRQIEEPDSFYGVQQPASLESVLGRLDHEADGFRSLMFRSARLDSHMRKFGNRGDEDAVGMVRSLSALDFNGLALALLSHGVGSSMKSSGAMLKAAQTLQQWDLNPSEDSGTEYTAVFSAFQEVGRSNEPQRVRERVQSNLVAHAKQALGMGTFAIPSHAWHSSLASMTEILEIVSSVNQHDLVTRWNIMQNRTQWMHLARFDDAKPILTNRQTLFGALRHNNSLRKLLRFDNKQSHALEAEALLSGSIIAREHGRLQEALVATTSISDLMTHYDALGLRVGAAVKHETALVLWKAGESSASVQMLRDTLAITDMEKQDVHVGRAGLNAQLAHQLADARLEKPEEIMGKYLKPAISQLKTRKTGKEAGQVFYEFATFCDHELQSPGNIENFSRMVKLRQGKQEEVDAIQAAMAKKTGADRKELQKSLSAAQTWLDIDTAETKRLAEGRKNYINQSLQNYLLTLGASDDHDICVLRFFALWLENSEDDSANGVALKYLKDVPSWKFVLLMNQLISRAEEEPSTFQTALKKLLTRICAEHPFHSAHHLFAASRKPSSNDRAAISRFSAAKSIWKDVTGDPTSKDVLDRIFQADSASKSLAELKPVLKERVTKFSASQFRESKNVAEGIPRLRLPPITMSIPLRPSGDYGNVPIVQSYDQRCSVMTGNSAPKLATCLASDGVRHKQLFKSGDDLRQDAIMEQVFGEVSNMLRNHRATRQRDLKVRTYKVVPLSAKSGVIEFVPNSMPLNDVLRPAHKKYYPQDWTDGKAREVISAVQWHDLETRLREFRKVCQHLNPVLRHFFFERYDDPDEWFQKRTAYTRTTASISILGHILGLGDRHNSNVMLDTSTGEVVHIDLGVAFEAGRVLPIPELVPFRLTRDIVDGMGPTGTEGVFRRCCEFTLDAVREDKDSIMTLLNVLRYDPLYSWTVSPLRAKKMQEALESGRHGGVNDESSSRKRGSEAGEAERALSIVEKKLSKTLSTAAAVNELIQAATDEEHLATLFHGWAAYY